MQRDLVQALCARQVEGLIIIPGTGEVDRVLNEEIRSGLKVVFVDRPPLGIEADVVLSDNVGGSYDGVCHLLASGHRRIAFIGDRPGLFTAQERHRGYRQALLEHGIGYDDELVVFDGLAPGATSEAVIQVTTGASPATAIFTGNSLLTIAVVTALETIPARPALLGFDDFQLAGLLRTPVSVIAQDPVAIGQVTTELLFRRLSGDEGRPQRVRIGTQLIYRGVDLTEVR